MTAVMEFHKRKELNKRNDVLVFTLFPCLIENIFLFQSALAVCSDTGSDWFFPWDEWYPSIPGGTQLC